MRKFTPQRIVQTGKSELSKTFQLQKSVLLVPCINCEELIPIDKADVHSRICNRVSKQVGIINKSQNPFDELNFKIKKIKDSLLQCIQNFKAKNLAIPIDQEEVGKNFLFLVRIYQICENINDDCKVQKMIDYKNELFDLCQNYKGSLNVSLNLQRLYCLIDQKVKIEMVKPDVIGHSTSSQALKAKIVEKKKEYDRIKAITQTYQENIQNQQKLLNQLLNIDNKQFQMISSQKMFFQSIGSVRKFIFLNSIIQEQNTTFNTQLSSSDEKKQHRVHNSEQITYFPKSQVDNERYTNDHQQQNVYQNDHVQRQFYEKCLNMKLKFPNTHLSQKIPISIIFKDAILNKINLEKWDLFIYNALQNPQKYLDMNKVRNENGFVRNTLRTKSMDSKFKEKIHNL